MDSLADLAGLQRWLIQGSVGGGSRYSVPTRSLKALAAFASRSEDTSSHPPARGSALNSTPCWVGAAAEPPSGHPRPQRHSAHLESTRYFFDTGRQRDNYRWCLPRRAPRVVGQGQHMPMT